MTEDTSLDYTSLAQKIKTGELPLSSVKSEYIAITALTTTSCMGYGPIQRTKIFKNMTKMGRV